MNTRGGIVLKFPNLSQAEILAISKALADTEYGFTGSELEVLLKQYDFADENPTMTKYKRLYNSFVKDIIEKSHVTQYICLFKSVWIQQGGL